MRKTMQALFAVLACLSFLAASVEARQTKTNASDSYAVALEAAWIAGGPGYQAAVSKAADAYAKKMDARCQGFVDASAAIKAYSVYTPPAAKAARDRLVKLQVVSLACMAKHNDGMARAARLRM